MTVRVFLEQPHQAVEVWPTGLSDLDHLLGGFRRGRLWVITGAPASGKSLLLTQLVFTLAAKHGFTTDYFCASVDSPELTRARLLSLAVRRAPLLPELTVPLDDLSDFQRASLDALVDSPLTISTGGGFTTPDLNEPPHPYKRCLAIDDPEGKRPPVLDATVRTDLRRFADAGAVVLVTVPRSLCVELGHAGDRLQEEWAAVADLIMEVIPLGTPGEWMLDVKQNRHGPQVEIRVVGQPFYGRFVDFRS